MSLKREAAVLALIRQGMHLSDIMIIEGLDPGNDRKRLKELAKKHGLSIIEGPRSAKKESTGPVPFVDESVNMRLGSALREVVNATDPDEVGLVTGMTRTERLRAYIGRHNWTLSQLSRLAKKINMTPGELLYNMENNSNELQMALNLRYQALAKDFKGCSSTNKASNTGPSLVGSISIALHR